jgi:hypothetical protein
MSAKHKLNSAHFMGSLVASGLIGLITESFAVFLVVLAAALAAAYHAGEIRK